MATEALSGWQGSPHTSTSSATREHWKSQCHSSKSNHLLLLQLPCHQISRPTGSPTGWITWFCGPKLEHHLSSHLARPHLKNPLEFGKCSLNPSTLWKFHIDQVFPRLLMRTSYRTPKVHLVYCFSLT